MVKYIVITRVLSYLVFVIVFVSARCVCAATLGVDVLIM